MPDRHYRHNLIGIHFTFQAFQKLHTLFVKSLANTDGNKIRKQQQTTTTKNKTKQTDNNNNNNKQTKKKRPVASLPTLKVGKTKN